MSRRKFGLWPLLFLLLLSSSGCVYLRLNALKNQLGEFPKYFSVDAAGARPVLISKKPVLREKDLSWLVGFEPSVRQAHGAVVTNLYLFDKVTKRGQLPGPYDELMFSMVYENDRLTRMSFPVQFRAFLTEENFIEMLSPIRDATTDAGKKKTEWTWQEMYIQIPSYERICEFLGKPSLHQEDEVTRDPFFRYQLQGHSGSDLFEFPLRMDYRVWKYNNRMYDVTCNVGRVFVYIDVSKKDKVVKMDLRK